MVTAAPQPTAPTLAAPAATIVLPLFSTTLFLSALLLFWIQPMFAKMALPLLGGSPAVWNTAMLFFQGALLAGYGYAHLITRRLVQRWQLLLHLGVLGMACLALPIGLAAWGAPPETTPTGWLLGLMAASIGMPFFALSANAPLLQRWFSTTGHPAAADPYFLYGASNLGSMLALLAYPVVMEPLLRLREQSLIWSALYVGLVMFIAGCGLVGGGLSKGVVGRDEAASRPHTAPTWSRRLRWLALSFVPASLLLGVTTHITTDIAATPLFWVVPLVLYLLTFVLTFARHPLLRHEWMLRAQPILVFPILLLIWFVSAGSPLNLVLHLAAFFVIAMVCHGELASRRPAAERLTEFYLWISLGGVLGGIFNAVVAPMVFNTVVEYPIILVLSCLMRPALPAPLSRSKFGLWFHARVSERQADVLLPAALCAMIVAPLLVFRTVLGGLPAIAVLVIAIVLACSGLAFSRRPLRLMLGAAISLLASSLIIPSGTITLERERSFFGVYRVTSSESGEFHLLRHGTTLHGAEYTDAARRDEPLAYYHRNGPLGQMFAALGQQDRLRHVGVVGLGTGTVACYRKPGQKWTFFEIDPTVTQLARDQRYFHYMADCAPDAPVVHGDARLSLKKVPDGQFDLLILDAFSSDSIPVHLMTREALLLYRDKLAPGGVLMFHISNRKLDLTPILANGAADIGMSAIAQIYSVPPEAQDDYILASNWVALANSLEDLAPLGQDARWRRLSPDPKADLWTDDYSNVLGALRW
jgi:spermidine synthase